MDNQQPNPRSPLTAFYDADPAGWRHYTYPGFVDLGVAANSQGTITLPTMFQPYMWTGFRHTVVGDIDDWESTGLKNDGQYLIEYADERSQYTSAPTPALLLSGPHKMGPFPDFSLPVFFPANHTIVFRLTNIYTRVLTPVAAFFRVWISIHGLQYWGKLQPPRHLLDYSQG